MQYLVQWKHTSVEEWLNESDMVFRLPIEQFENSLLKHEIVPKVCFLFISADSHNISGNFGHCFFFCFQKEFAFSPPTPSIVMTENSLPNILPKVKQRVFPQTQQKTKGEITNVTKVQDVLDIIRKGPNGDIVCLVKYKGINRVAWIPFKICTSTEPQKVIKYFESRVEWPNRS